MKERSLGTGGATLGANILDEDAPLGMEALADSVWKTRALAKHTKLLIDTLTPAEQAVLKARFSDNPSAGIRELEARTIRKLRNRP